MFRVKVRQDTCQIRSFYFIFSHWAIHLLMLCNNGGNKWLFDCWNVFVKWSFFHNDLWVSFLFIKLNILLDLLLEHILALLLLDNAVQPRLRKLTNRNRDDQIVQFDAILLCLVWVMNKIVIEPSVLGMLLGGTWTLARFLERLINNFNLGCLLARRSGLRS